MSLIPAEAKPENVDTELVKQISREQDPLCKVWRQNRTKVDLAFDFLPLFAEFL